MSVIGSNILAGASSQGGYTIEESLRFNSSQSSYLSWTPATAGDRTTWTWSGWVKRGTLGGTQSIFSTATANDVIYFDVNNNLTFFTSGNYYSIPPNAFRDTSAWYHFVFVWDTNNATQADRIRVYVNGERLAFGSGTQAASGATSGFNNNVVHGLGYAPYVGSYYFDGYITEVNFIDGQALTPSDFGEYSAVTGVWQPVGYTGTYGTNGFYLPMKLDNTVEGFNTVTYIGTGSTQKISGVGFSPDLIWTKSRSDAESHNLIDSVRGSFRLRSNNTDVESAATVTFDNDGFTVGSQSESNTGDMVAWCWDAGGTTVSNTDGSITSSLRANPAYGFSVVTYTGNGTQPSTVGHGLGGVAPSMVIVKTRNSASYDWNSYHVSLGNTQYIALNTTLAASSAVSLWNNTSPTSTVFSLNHVAVNTLSNTYVAYCFSEIAGYSKFGSYTGTGATGNAVTTGFRPAFVMVKRTDGVNDWLVWDSTRVTTENIPAKLSPNTSSAEYSSASGVGVEFTDAGFAVNGLDDAVNASGGTYIYMAFKDTREYAFWLDDSGNNNDWQPNGGITTESTVTDTPTPYLDGGNYAVLNPLDTQSGVLSNANLTVTTSSSNYSPTRATISVTSGKWYWEVVVGSGTSTQIGIYSTNELLNTAIGANAGSYGYYSATGQKVNNNSYTAYGASYTTGDVIGHALDMDAGTLTFYKNNTSQGTAFSGLSGQFAPAVSDASTAGTQSINANFGQRPFSYTPPTGFKSLHTGNLPDAAIENGSEYFAATTYTGNGGTQSISNDVNGVSFQPDWVWIKERSSTSSHTLSDSVRGAGAILLSDSTAAELTGQVALTAFNSDGFSVGSDGKTNAPGDTYVGWQWKAGGAAVTNELGSITSQVSASPTAGFSVVTWTNPASGTPTIGHGLGVAPAFIIVKDRTFAYNWDVGCDAIGWANRLNLNATSATSSGFWNSTAPTSTVFTYAASGANSGDSMVAYCFSEVPGYSKFGSYTGNGSGDDSGNGNGPFVYLGFRPRFVMAKSTTSGTANWAILDTSRAPYNNMRNEIWANSSSAEESYAAIDALSNGFKLRSNSGQWNANGAVYIYMAFAENPFKNSLAR